MCSLCIDPYLCDSVTCFCNLWLPIFSLLSIRYVLYWYWFQLSKRPSIIIQSCFGNSSPSLVYSLRYHQNPPLLNCKHIQKDKKYRTNLLYRILRKYKQFLFLILEWKIIYSCHVPVIARHEAIQVSIVFGFFLRQNNRNNFELLTLNF